MFVILPTNLLFFEAAVGDDEVASPLFVGMQ